jgi:hypothetical protein
MGGRRQTREPDRRHPLTIPPPLSRDPSSWGNKMSGATASKRRRSNLGVCCRLKPNISRRVKLDLRGKTAPGIVLRRRPSHTGQENPRTPAPPIHSGIEAHVRTTTTEAEP